ncbi:MAG: hypothetical protein HKN12_04750 [Gemmatimonadetes bacterium]|nr:hypothetical protein [Gemmatimonadota bacterium]
MSIGGILPRPQAHESGFCPGPERESGGCGILGRPPGESRPASTRKDLTISDASSRAAAAHEKACARGDLGYLDPDTGYLVMTRLAHLARGRCCGSACRHCPYDHENVPRDATAPDGPPEDPSPE